MNADVLGGHQLEIRFTGGVCRGDHHSDSNSIRHAVTFLVLWLLGEGFFVSEPKFMTKPDTPTFTDNNISLRPLTQIGLV